MASAACKFLGVGNSPGGKTLDFDAQSTAQPKEFGMSLKKLAPLPPKPKSKQLPPPPPKPRKKHQPKPLPKPLPGQDS